MEYVSSLALVLVFMSIGFLVSKALNLTYILGYVILGIIYGLAFTFEKDAIHLISEIAVMLLFFFIGLEFSIGKIKPIFRNILWVSLMDLLANFLLSFLIFLKVSGDVRTAMIMGAILYPSSSIIIVKLLESRRRLSNIEVPIIFGVLIFEDIFMVVLLGFITSMGENVLLKPVLILSVMLIAFLLNVRFRKYLNAFVSLLAKQENELKVVSLLAILFVSAKLALLLGVHAYFGTFILGMLLADTSDRFFEEHLSYFKDLFLGFFFFFFGYELAHINIRPEYLLPALGIFVLSMLFKILAFYVSPYDRTTALRAGFTSVPRGEFSIILTSLLPEGVLRDTMLTFMILSIVLGITLADKSPKLARIFVKTFNIFKSKGGLA